MADVAQRPSGHRLDSIDFLRGLIMIVMALDHVRDWFTNAAFNPLNLAFTTTPYFLTRWITHFCAPVFSLLTGVGAYLWFARGRTRGELSRFLLTRGLWLIFLEVVATRCLGWAFNFNYEITVAIVLWALGWSMIVLAGAVWLPSGVLTAVAMIVIAGHNLFDSVTPKSFGSFAWLWLMLHGQGNLELAKSVNFFIAYPVMPWFAVMMAGYSLGRVFAWDAERRRAFLLRAGTVTTLLFFVIRFVNHYGDRAPWSAQKSALFTVFSFLNCTKNPPSLDYLLMTLGPALLVLGAIDGFTFARLRPVVAFGRVPLFYFIVHIPLMHLAAIAVALIQFGDASSLFVSHTIADFPAIRPAGWGFGLPGVYAIWIALVLILYPLCRWFAALKRRNNSAWLSYL